MAKRPRKVDNIFDIFPPTNSHNFVVYTNCPLRVVSFNAAKGALDLNYGYESVDKIIEKCIKKDSVQISRYFINFALSHAAQQTITSL